MFISFLPQLPWYLSVLQDVRVTIKNDNTGKATNYMVCSVWSFRIKVLLPYRRRILSARPTRYKETRISFL